MISEANLQRLRRAHADLAFARAQADAVAQKLLPCGTVVRLSHGPHQRVVTVVECAASGRLLVEGATGRYWIDWSRLV